MGCDEYITMDNKFQTVVPGNSKALLAELKGSPDKAQDAAVSR